MSAELEAPAVDLELVPAEAGGPPGGVGLQRGELRDEEIQQRAAHRQGVADPKHELDVQGPTDRALPGKAVGSVQHARVEDLDLRLDVLCQQQYGRAQGRDRGWQDVWVWLCAVNIQQKK